MEFLAILSAIGLRVDPFLKSYDIQGNKQEVTQVASLC